MKKNLTIASFIASSLMIASLAHAQGEAVANESKEVKEPAKVEQPKEQKQEVSKAKKAKHGKAKKG